VRPVAPPPPPEVLESLDDAIFSVVRSARPSVGRTACVEILHGARSKKIKENSYDGLGAYAMASHMRRPEILARVDELIAAGRLASSGGKFPKLKVVPQSAAIAA
jgi:ATP-dependent DNA helicase RecQ